MLLTRYGFTQPLSRLHESMDRWVDSALSGLTSTDRPFFAGGRFPALNIWEDERTLFVEAEVPGVTMDSIDVSILDGELTIRATRSFTLPEGAAVIRQDRPTGEFVRAFTLPCAVDESAIDASLKDGVLTITLPKAAEVMPRKIAVKGR